MLVDNKVYLFFFFETKSFVGIRSENSEFRDLLSNSVARRTTSTSNSNKFAFVLSPQRHRLLNRRWIFLLGKSCFSLLTFHYIRVEGEIPPALNWLRRESHSLSLSVHQRTHRREQDIPFVSRDISPQRSRTSDESARNSVHILLTENRWKNHDRSKYSTRWSRLARNDI